MVHLELFGELELWCTWNCLVSFNEVQLEVFASIIRGDV